MPNESTDDARTRETTSLGEADGHAAAGSRQRSSEPNLDIPEPLQVDVSFVCFYFAYYEACANPAIGRLPTCGPRTLTRRMDLTLAAHIPAQ